MRTSIAALVAVMNAKNTLIAKTKEPSAVFEAANPEADKIKSGL